MPKSDLKAYQHKYQYYADAPWSAALNIQQKLIKLTDQELIWLNNKEYNKCHDLELRVNNLLSAGGGGMFFKLSSRSAKDLPTWPQIARVHCFADVLKQYKASDRIQDDVKLHLYEQSKKNKSGHVNDNALYFCFRPWIDDIAEEYRCFVVENEIIAYCEYESQKSVTPPCQLDESILRKLSSVGYSTYAVDLYTRASDSTPTLHVTEINELSPFTDCMDYSYYELLYLQRQRKIKRLESQLIDLKIEVKANGRGNSHSYLRTISPCSIQ